MKKKYRKKVNKMKKIVIGTVVLLTIAGGMAKVYRGHKELNKAVKGAMTDVMEHRI